MLGVYITINGVPILARTAVNRGSANEPGHGSPGVVMYECDDGSAIFHDPKDGAVVLAKKLLDTIREQQPTPEKEPAP